ncbi:MAG: S-layer homology domain-containing protein [Methylocystaceae bacterium]
MCRIHYKLGICLLAVVVVGTLLAVTSPVYGADVNAAAAGSNIQVTGTAQPYSQISVQVTSASQRVYINQGVSDEDGSFSFVIPVIPGSYQIQVNSQDLNPAAIPVTITGSEPANPGAPPVVTKQAQISITGYDGSILPPTTITWQGTATVLSLLQKAASTYGISLEIRNGYVAAIGGQEEFAHGPTSGWKYRLNGSVPGAGAGSKVVADGDEIQWFYVEQDDQAVLLPPIVNINQTELKAAQVEGVVKYIKSIQPLTDWGAMGLWYCNELAVDQYGKTLVTAIKNAGPGSPRVTDLERQAIIAGLLGIDTASIEGRNLIAEIYSHKRLTMQGTNGVAFALIALDSCGADTPQNSLWNRDKIITWLLNEQRSDGAWGLANGMAGDVDVTAMTLTALAPYQKQETVKNATAKALKWLAGIQLADGGYANSGIENSESSSQVILALCSLGISPEDTQFTKAKGSLTGCWLQYLQPDGGFAHIAGGSSDPTASEQALLALVAWQRFQQHLPPIYTHIVTTAGQFADAGRISDWAKMSVKKAYDLGIIKGVTLQPLCFAPDRVVTRAELMAMLMRMDLPAAANPRVIQFQDVRPKNWYYDSVTEAANRGWITGTSRDSFEPDRAISRQEIALVLAKVYPQQQSGQKDFLDISLAYPEARQAISQAAASGLMTGADNRFDPRGQVTREMAATILIRLYDLLSKK